MNLPVQISAEMLPDTEWRALLAMAPALRTAFATRQIFRTETEARVSVLNDLHHPTPGAKYWQSVREQCVMLEQLALMSFEWRRNELAIKRHNAKIAAGELIDIEEVQIDLDECLFRRANLRSVAADRMREIRMWEMLKAECGTGFDAQNVDAHQLVSYTAQFALRFAHADPAGMSAGELDNLVGQLHTAIRRCQETGVLGSVLENLSPDVAEHLRARIQASLTPANRDHL